jgi:hypothetical protein
MNNEAGGKPAFLGPDFAQRVVVRVRTTRRRRRLYRWALASSATCVIAAAAIFYFAARRPGSQAERVAGVNQVSSERIAASAEFSFASGDNSSAFTQPLSFFFPGASTVADFESSEASYWHSYDSWWSAQP